MANTNPATYLPPGWTEERFKAATPQDIAGLPDEQYHAVMQRYNIGARLESDKVLANEANRRAEVNASRTAAGYETLEAEEARLATEGRSNESDIEIINDAMHRNHVEEWGYVVVRYGFDKKKTTLKTFQQKWDQTLARFLEEFGSLERPELGVVEKLTWHWIDLPKVEDETSKFEVARDAVRTLRDHKALESGLDHYVFLFVDEETRSQVVSTSSTNASSPSPWVYAVDMDFEGMEEISEGDDEYPGYFKMALDEAILLWPEFIAGVANPEELYPGRDKVYRGIMSL